MATNDYAPGQIWLYKSRPGEERSTVVIDSIEPYGDGSVFHITINHLRLKNAGAPDGVIRKITHAPVSRETLDASVTQLVGIGPVDPDYREGYELWKQASDEGKAGIWGIAVADIVSAMEFGMAS